MLYVLQVFMADTSSLKNRALVFAFANTPYIVTTWVGPRAAMSFVETSGFRWAYGTFCIVTPVIALPIIAVLWFNQRKAMKEGLLVKEKSGRSFGQSVSYYFWEFDGKPSGRSEEGDYSDTFQLLDFSLVLQPSLCSYSLSLSQHTKLLNGAHP
jgi:MFS family permease